MGNKQMTEIEALNACREHWQEMYDKGLDANNKDTAESFLRNADKFGFEPYEVENDCFLCQYASQLNMTLRGFEGHLCEYCPLRDYWLTEPGLTYKAWEIDEGALCQSSGAPWWVYLNYSDPEKLKPAALRIIKMCDKAIEAYMSKVRSVPA